MTKRVVFISLPMSGYPDEVVLGNIERAKAAYLQLAGLDISQVAFVHNLLVQKPEYYVKESQQSLWYLGRAIQALVRCDEVFFWFGWKKARGCMIEHEVCTMYDIPYISVEMGGGYNG